MKVIRKIKKISKNPRKETLHMMSKLYNIARKRKAVHEYGASDFKEYNDIWEKSLADSGISDHLINLFVESLSMKPRLIVELGVRGGESTFVLERVAKLSGAKLISVDIEDCSGSSSYGEWNFVQEDDIAFGKRFIPWCRERRIEPSIDILFIDTSHLYEHTAQEIRLWFDFLSDKCKVFFHDTNLKNVYFKKDGSMHIGWDNGRGVIRAVEDYFGASFDEKKNFVDFRKGWLIKHYSYCSGFTILEKII